MGELTEFTGTEKWYNYTTGEFDERTAHPLTDKEAIQYIPLSSASHNLYRVHQQLGKSILEAMEAVLTAHISSRER